MGVEWSNMAHRKDIITKNQQETLDFIKKYLVENGYAPTVTEIKDHFKLASLRSVTQRIDALQRKGLIVREKYKQRGIKLIGDATDLMSSIVRRIPLLGTAGADNITRYAEESYDEFLMVDTKTADPRKEIVAVQAIGRSMEDAGIHDKDYVLVEVTEHPVNGDLVVALIGEMAVVKRFYDNGEKIILSPEAKISGYREIILDKGLMNEDKFKIVGRVISVLPSKNNDDDITIEPINPII